MLCVGRHVFHFAHIAEQGDGGGAADVDGEAPPIALAVEELETRKAGAEPAGKGASYPDVIQILAGLCRACATERSDNQFADIVRWALYAMIEAEEYGITSKNVDEMLKSENPSIKRILGVTPGMGKALGVDEKWVYNIVKQVGNYGESFDRNVGMGSPLKIARGQNALWTQGGLQYAPPIR